MSTDSGDVRASAGPAPCRTKPMTIALGIALSLLIVVLPLVGALVSYAQSDEPIDRRMVIGGMMAAGILCVLAWSGVFLVRVMRRMASKTLGHGFVIQDAGVVRTLLQQHDLTCRACGYNLRGLAAGPCPECQEPIRLVVNSGNPFVAMAWLPAFALAAFGARVLAAVVGAVLVARQWSLWWGMPPALRMSMVLWGVSSAIPIIGCLPVGVVTAGWTRSGAQEDRGEAKWRVVRLVIVFLAATELVNLASIASQLLF